MKTFNRSYGVELEIIGGINTPTGIATALRASGIEAYQEGYNHEARPHWKLVYDGSLTGENAIELVSPILYGEDGLKQIITVCAVLNRLGVTVNNTCGLHVHVDARGATTRNLQNLLRTWAKYERNSSEVVAPRRRDTFYARHMFGGASLTEDWARIDRIAERASGPMNFAYDFTGGVRYYTLNLLAFIAHGSVEFRNHGGTTDADKICNWVKLCVNTVSRSFALTGTVRPNGAGDFSDFLYGIDAKARKFFNARRQMFAGRVAA